MDNRLQNLSTLSVDELENLSDELVNENHHEEALLVSKELERREESENTGRPLITNGYHGDSLEDDGSAYLKLVDSEKQMLGFRVGPVYNSGSGMDEVAGLWIEYQREDFKSEMMGPVLISPEIWHQIVDFIGERLASFKPSNYVVPTDDSEENNASS